MKKFAKGLLKLLVIYLVLTAVFALLFKTTLMITRVPTGSMKETIAAGDIVFCTKYDVKSEEDISRYDILVFIPPDNPNVTYIKRVIGLPEETIEVKEGKVYADGIELDDSFVKNPMNRKGDGTYIVPEGCYFFMGDNRNQSRDSRFWTEKYVPSNNIVAKAKYVLFPFRNIQYNVI